MGAAAVNGTGNGLNNILIGNSACEYPVRRGGQRSSQKKSRQQYLDGGTGTDTANYIDKSAPVFVTLNGSTAATVFISGVAEDTIRNIAYSCGRIGRRYVAGRQRCQCSPGAFQQRLFGWQWGVATLIGGSWAEDPSFLPASRRQVTRSPISTRWTMSSSFETAVSEQESEPALWPRLESTLYSGRLRRQRMRH